MIKIKRNDPCLCGSGKKYKKCCEKTIIQRTSQFSKEEWEKAYNNLLPKLTSYLRKNKFKNDFYKAANMVFPDQCTADDELEDDQEYLLIVFLVNCYQYFPSKKTLIELFSDENAFSLLPVERATLNNLLMGKWKIFKVVKLEKEHYMRILDVFNDEITQITSIDKINLRADKIYTGLIFKMGEDNYISGIVTNIPEEKLDLVTSTLMEEFHKAEETGERIEFSLFLKYNAHRIFQLIDYGNRPKIRNRDGSAIRFWSIVFEILNHEKFVKSIKNDSMIQWDNDNYFSWLLKGRTAGMLEYDEYELTEPFTVFGNGRIEGDLLFIEVNSTKRMEVAVDYLSENYTEELSLIDTENLGDVHSYKPQEEPGQSDNHDDELSKEEKYELEKHFLKDFYYNKWIYDPIPVLDYLSPIEAFEEKPEEFEALLKGINNTAGNNSVDIDDLRKHIAKRVKVERGYQHYKNIQIEIIQNAFIEYLMIKNEIGLSDRYNGTIEPYYNYLVLYNDTLHISEVVEVQDSTVTVWIDDDYQELDPSDFYYRISEEEEYQLDFLSDKKEYQTDFAINFLRKLEPDIKSTEAVFGFHKVIFGIVDFVDYYLKESDEMTTCALREYSDSFPQSKYYFKDKHMDISAMECFQAIIFPDQFFSFDSDLSKNLKKSTSKTDRVVWYICYLITQYLFTNDSHEPFDINNREAQSYLKKIYNTNANHIIDEMDFYLEVVNRKRIFKKFTEYLTLFKSEL